MIVLSCWLPALTLFSIRKDSPSQRLGCVAATLVLDVMAVLVLPIGIMHPYTKLHNARKQHGDEWLVKILLSFQLLDEQSRRLA